MIVSPNSKNETITVDNLSGYDTILETEIVVATNHRSPARSNAS